MKKRLTNPLLYLTGLLIFFLPFIHIKCNDKSLDQFKGWTNEDTGKLSGYSLALGAKFKSKKADIQDTATNKSTSKAQEKLEHPNGLIILSLMSLFVGLFYAIISKLYRPTLHLVLASIGGLSLFALMIIIWNDKDANMQTRFIRLVSTLDIGFYCAISLFCVLFLVNMVRLIINLTFHSKNIKL